MLLGDTSAADVVETLETFSEKVTLCCGVTVVKVTISSVCVVCVTSESVVTLPVMFDPVIKDTSVVGLVVVSVLDTTGVVVLSVTSSPAFSIKFCEMLTPFSEKKQLLYLIMFT